MYKQADKPARNIKRLNDMKTSMREVRKANRHTTRMTYRQADPQTHKQTPADRGKTDIPTGNQTARQINTKQTDRWSDEQRDRPFSELGHTGRRANTYKYTKTGRRTV